jgi:uncharacterized protein (DUF111 family)
MTHHPETTRPDSGPILTVRAISGLSGDMMLAGLAAIGGVGNDELQNCIAELGLPELEGCLSLESRAVNGIAGHACRVNLPHEHAHRNLQDIEGIIRASAMPVEAKDLALAAFALLAEAEAAVHGARPQDVHFHEVGALDSILDACLVCRLCSRLAPRRFVCSPLPLADGVITCAHGRMLSPAPAVLRLLPGVRVRGFAGSGETVTPTALSLLRALGADFGPWPDMTVENTAISYGDKIFPDTANGAVWAIGY